MSEQERQVITPEDKAELAIGSFNPNDREDVAAIKKAAKNLIIAIDTVCPDGRRKSFSITQIEAAQMMAVKSLFAK